MFFPQRTVQSPIEQFVGRVKEAVKGPNAAQEIQKAVSLLLSNYQSDIPTRR
ncbi:hypothetical protein EDC14_1001192 [Hydrogenispora ethanolica]|uniref:Uncharacterized protein n=1 Tax=Hydrogenispora ethanolica TaxID=1082276 RepID=A0A4V2QGR6_HYDET|nr:hypothetical protein EDC14_1001192 [Hydrogenispora ethanolica]